MMFEKVTEMCPFFYNLTVIILLLCLTGQGCRPKYFAKLVHFLQRRIPIAANISELVTKLAWEPLVNKVKSDLCFDLS